MVGFPPYYKPTYAWEPLPASYDLHPMSFSPTVLQHAGGVYGNHVGRGAQPQQPLDCSAHYSPTSNTYHCITCDKVSISRSTSALVFFPRRGGKASSRVYYEIPPLTTAVLLENPKNKRCSRHLTDWRSTSGGPTAGRGRLAATSAGRPSAMPSAWSST